MLYFWSGFSSTYVFLWFPLEFVLLLSKVGDCQVLRCFGLSTGRARSCSSYDFLCFYLLKHCRTSTERAQAWLPLSMVFMLLAQPCFISWCLGELSQDNHGEQARADTTMLPTSQLPQLGTSASLCFRRARDRLASPFLLKNLVAAGRPSSPFLSCFLFFPSFAHFLKSFVC